MSQYSQYDPIVKEECHLLAWVIFLIILFLLFLISFIRIRVIVEYNDTLQIYVRIMHIFRIPISPAKEKKIKLSHYTDKSIAKRARKQQQKEARKAQKKESKNQRKLEKKQQKKDSPHAGSGRSLSDNISLIIDVVKVLLTRFFKHLRIDLTRIHISIAGEDAAQTAILYGMISQSIAYLLEIMNTLKTTTPPNVSEVSVVPDWTGEKNQVDIKLAFSLRVSNIFDMIFRVIGRAISHLFHDMKKKNESHSQSSKYPPSSNEPKKKTSAKATPSQN